MKSSGYNCSIQSEYCINESYEFLVDVDCSELEFASTTSRYRKFIVGNDDDAKTYDQWATSCSGELSLILLITLVSKTVWLFYQLDVKLLVQSNMQRNHISFFSYWIRTC